MAQLPEEGQPVVARQPQVQHQEIVGIDAERIESALGAADTVDRETMRGESVVERCDESSIVFHDEEPHEFARIAERTDRCQHHRSALRAATSRSVHATLSSLTRYNVLVLRRDHLFERLPGRLRSPPGDDRSVDSVPSRGSSHDPCPHRALLPPPLAELHTPLIVAPALLKPGIVKALALLSSSR